MPDSGLASINNTKVASPTFPDPVGGTGSSSSPVTQQIVSETNRRESIEINYSPTINLTSQGNPNLDIQAILQEHADDIVAMVKKATRLDNRLSFAD